MAKPMMWNGTISESFNERVRVFDLSYMCVTMTAIVALFGVQNAGDYLSKHSVWGGSGIAKFHVSYKDCFLFSVDDSLPRDKQGLKMHLKIVGGFGNYKL